MLAQICQFLAVDSSNFPQNEHIIIDDRSREGCFMIHYFLSLCQKQKRPLCFVSFSQSFNHYNTVAQKLGTSLLSARDENKNLIFIEALKILEDCILPADKNIRRNDYETFEELLRGNVVPFISLIVESTRKLKTTTSSNLGPVVIIDDLSFLLNVGLKAQQVQTILTGLQCLTSDENKCSLVTFMHANEEDEESAQVRAFSSHLSSLRIAISDLKTGYCKEVHGQMEVQWRSTNEHPRKVILKQSQFKLTEKSVDFFAAGLSTAVL